MNNPRFFAMPRRARGWSLGTTAKTMALILPPALALALLGPLMPHGAAVEATSTESSSEMGATQAIEAERAFLIQDRRVESANALVQSTRRNRLYYTHNGRAQSTRLIVINDRGKTRGVMNVSQARNVSWQDVDAGPRHSLFIGDVGDADETRRRIVVYRVTEPRRPARNTTRAAQRYAFSYPDGRHDASAIMVNPKTGRVFVVTNDDEVGAIYRAPARLSTSTRNRLVRVASAPAGVTGASFVPGGSSYVLGTASEVYRYDEFGGASNATAKPPAVTPGKSLLVNSDGAKVLMGTTSAAPSPVWQMRTPRSSKRSLTAPTATLLTSTQGDYTDPSTQIGLAWKPVSGASVEGYRFGYVTSDPRESDKEWTSPVIPEASAERPFVFTTLVPGASYAVFVEVVSTRGKTARTTLQAKTDMTDREPGSPASVSVSNLTSTTMTADWGQPADPGSSPVDGYQVGWGGWDSALLDGSARSMDLTGFTANTGYTIRVRAHNSTGYGPWRSHTVTTPSATPVGDREPGSPSSVSVSNLTSTTMTADWGQPADPGSSPVDGYQVGWGGWDSALLDGSARSMDLTGFTANTGYTIRVRAHNSTGYGPWRSHTVTTPDASVPTSPGVLGLPSRVTGVYWSNWNSQIKITQLPTSYNTIYLFAAPRGSTEGSVSWNSSAPTSAEIDVVRGRRQRVILSTGGAGNGISFHARYVSQNFVDSIVAINRKFGGTLTNPKIDGVDFNTFEADATPNTSEYLWMFGELKRLFGANFIISSPPAPWKAQDKAMIKQALTQGLMDYAAPQYYDGPGLSDPNYIVTSVRDWIQNVAGGKADKIVVGFGMENLPNYSTVSEIRSAWNTLEAEYPNIRGAFLWQHRTDYDRQWSYATTINPLVAD